MAETISSLENRIIENASGPKSAEIDGQKVEQHSLSDVIEADQYLASKSALKGKSRGLKFSKLQPSGA